MSVRGERSNNTELLAWSLWILEKRKLWAGADSLHCHGLVELQFPRLFNLLGCILTVLWGHSAVADSRLSLKAISSWNCVWMAISLILEALGVMQVASLWLIYRFIWRQVVIANWQAAAAQRLHSVLAPCSIVRSHIRTETFAGGKSFLILDWTIHCSLQIFVVEAQLWLKSTGDVARICIFVKNLMRSACCLLLEHAVPAPRLCSILSSSGSIGSIIERLCIALSILWLGCRASGLIHLVSTLWITLYGIIRIIILIINIGDLINRIFANIQLIASRLVLKSLMLWAASDARLFEVLRFHELLTGLRMRFHGYWILSKTKLICSASFLFHVLTSGRRRRHLVVVSSADRSLRWNWCLGLHEIGRVNLVCGKHLFRWIAQSRSNGLSTVYAGRRHTCHPWHVDHSSLNEVARCLPSECLVSIHVFHR